MIRINQVKLAIGHTSEQLTKKLQKLLYAPELKKEDYSIVKRSIDARKKPDIYYSYTVDVKLGQEKRRVERAHNNNIVLVQPGKYQFPHDHTQEPAKQKKAGAYLNSGDRPVIIGMGPAGLFCGYLLSLHGFAPILIERGREVALRKRDVEDFWKNGVLNEKSNVQFGEGGAGTFSDGKLNTLVKDPSGRNQAVLQIFVKAGAPENILYDSKPHIGTDILAEVVKNMRQEILANGGQVHFESQVTDFAFEKSTRSDRQDQGEITYNRISRIQINHDCWIPVRYLVLAIGHSARDTFEALYQRKLPMEAKAFAVGLRVEHPQKLINQSQYGMPENRILGAAPYKVAASTSRKRNVYSFCMCPGGYVVNASSEKGRLAVNGMSYSTRDGKNANSAIIVAVTKEDFKGDSPLSGMYFQQWLEEKAYQIGQGAIPVERYGDFKKAVEGKKQQTEDEKESAGEMDWEPEIKGRWQFSDVHDIMPPSLNEAFVEGMEAFGGMIHGFNAPETLLEGIESRTSSPVRMHRDETLQSAVRGIFPCGEGAGYAGGITSAAMDGIKVAEEVARLIMDIEAEKKEKCSGLETK